MPWLYPGAVDIRVLKNLDFRMHLQLCNTETAVAAEQRHKFLFDASVTTSTARGQFHTS